MRVRALVWALGAVCLACGSSDGGGGQNKPDASVGGHAGSGGSAKGGTGGTPSGGSAGTSSGGSAGTPSGGTAGTPSGGTAGAPSGGSAGTSSGGTGGAAGASGGNLALCNAACANEAAAGNCPSGQFSCESFCLALVDGACAADWHSFVQCKVDKSALVCLLQPTADCPPPNCSPGAAPICAAYCDKAGSASGCTLSESCATTCATNTSGTAPCPNQYIALYQCATSYGTPQCTSIDPGPSCSGQDSAVSLCLGTGGSGGTGGAGGTGGTGASGGTGGTGGNGGTGGTPSCSQITQDYATALNSAKYCTSPTSCTGQADKQLGCTCQTVINPSNASAAQTLAQLKLQFYQQNCDANVICSPCGPPPSGYACSSNLCTAIP